MKINLFKFAKIAPLAAAFTLPFAAVSCGEKEEEKKAGVGDAATMQSHTAIGKEVNAEMLSLLEQMAAIKDTKTAQEFADGFPPTKEKLKGLLEAAKKLAPPTDEEKATVQALKDASDAKAEELLGGLMKLMTENPESEAIGAIMGKVMQDEEMDEITDGLEKIYGLKDADDEDEAGEVETDVEVETETEAKPDSE